MYELQKEISHISQNQLSMNNYFTNFKVLWDELANQDPLPSCACVVMQILMDDREYAIRFLLGLNENYASAKPNSHERSHSINEQSLLSFSSR